jgi:hypothetical protein
VRAFERQKHGKLQIIPRRKDLAARSRTIGRPILTDEFEARLEANSLIIEFRYRG